MPNHDAEYYIVELQNREKWAAEDADLDTRLAQLREKHGTPPNIIHLMFDDLAFGDLGIPQLAAIRGIYSHFNLPWNVEKEDAIRAYIIHSPKNKHGRHTYSAADFGLSEAQIRERLPAAVSV